MGLLQDRTTTEIVTDGQVSGYVFAGETRDGVQRLEWVFFANFRHARESPMTLRPVSNREWYHVSLESFAGHVRRCHEPELGWSFCHATATSNYRPRAAHYALQPEREAPALSALASHSMSVISSGDIGVTGMCYAHKRQGEPHAAVEYWNLGSDYVAAPKDTVTVKALNEPATLAITETIKIAASYGDEPVPVASFEHRCKP